MRRSGLMVLLSVALTGCASTGDADVVLQTDLTPLTNSERTNIEGTLGDSRNVEMVGRINGPHGESILVTYGQGQYDQCYAVFEGSGYSAGCGTFQPPQGSVIVGNAYHDGHTGLVVDTSQEGITSVRVATGTGETYEVAALSQLSYITFENTQAGFTLSLLTGDGLVHQEG